MWANFYEASKQSPFRNPFTKAECETKSPSKTKTDSSPPPPKGGSCEYGSPKFFLLCAAGGALSCGLTHTLVTPLDLVKCRIQTNPEKYGGIINGFKVTYAEDGLKGLARGWAPTLIGYSMQGAFKFGLYEYFKILYSDLAGKENAYTYRTLMYLAASASAEFFADIALSPMEAIKVKIQTTEGYGSTLREAAPRMRCEEGMKAFYKTLVPLWLRQIPYTMMKFACFERTLEALYVYVVQKPMNQCNKPEQLTVTFAAGYIAGVFCAIVSHPADTIVSKMNQEQGTGAVEMFKRLWFMGLWKGLATRIIMIGTLTGLQWFIYDGVKVWLDIPRPPPPTLPKTETQNIGQKTGERAGKKTGEKSRRQRGQKTREETCERINRLSLIQDK